MLDRWRDSTVASNSTTEHTNLVTLYQVRYHLLSLFSQALANTFYSEVYLNFDPIKEKRQKKMSFLCKTVLSIWHSYKSCFVSLNKPRPRSSAHMLSLSCMNGPGHKARYTAKLDKFATDRTQNIYVIRGSPYSSSYSIASLTKSSVSKALVYYILCYMLLKMRLTPIAKRH